VPEGIYNAFQMNMFVATILLKALFSTNPQRTHAAVMGSCTLERSIASKKIIAMAMPATQLPLAQLGTNHKLFTFLK